MVPGMDRARLLTGLLRNNWRDFFAESRDGLKQAPRTLQNPEYGLADASCIRHIALKTGSSSPGELVMTFSTSDVAAC